MDRPENGILIFPRIDRLEDGSFVTLIRRITFVDGFMITKELLSFGGEWINVPEGEEYPEECFLKSSVLDRSLDNLEFDWPLLVRPYRKVEQLQE